MGNNLSDEDKERVRIKAKGIMENFMGALKDVDDIPIEFGSEREKDARDFFDNKYEGEEFRARFLKNAKNVDNNQIVAEREKW